MEQSIPIKVSPKSLENVPNAPVPVFNWNNKLIGVFIESLCWACCESPRERAFEWDDDETDDVGFIADQERAIAPEKLCYRDLTKHHSKLLERKYINVCLQCRLKECYWVKDRGGPNTKLLPGNEYYPCVDCLTFGHPGIPKWREGARETAMIEAYTSRYGTRNVSPNIYDQWEVEDRIEDSEDGWFDCERSEWQHDLGRCTNHPPWIKERLEPLGDNYIPDADLEEWCIAEMQKY